MRVSATSPTISAVSRRSPGRIICCPTAAPPGKYFRANASFNNLGFPIASTVFNWGKTTLGTIPFALAGARLWGAEGALAGQGLGAVVFGVIGVWWAYRSVRRLKVNWNRVMNACLDPLFRQRIPQAVSVVAAHGVDVIDVATSRPLLWDADGLGVESLGMFLDVLLVAAQQEILFRAPRLEQIRPEIPQLDQALVGLLHRPCRVRELERADIIEDADDQQAEQRCRQKLPGLRAAGGVLLGVVVQHGEDLELGGEPGQRRQTGSRHFSPPLMPVSQS